MQEQGVIGGPSTKTRTVQPGVDNSGKVSMRLQVAEEQEQGARDSPNTKAGQGRGREEGGAGQDCGQGQTGEIEAYGQVEGAAGED